MGGILAAPTDRVGTLAKQRRETARSRIGTRGAALPTRL